MSPGTRSKFTFGVYTDAGTSPPNMYLLLDNCSPTEAYAVDRALRKRGWKVEFRAVPDGRVYRPSWRGVFLGG